MGQAQPPAGWCWVLSVVYAQMGPCSYIELRVWCCRTNRRTHYSDTTHTSGTHKNTWTDGFGCRHTMLAEYHQCQHLISKQWMIQQFNNIAVLLLFLSWMWIPSKRRRPFAKESCLHHFVLLFKFKTNRVRQFFCIIICRRLYIICHIFVVFF